jgi:LAO/AO transport system kinase
VAIVAIDPSSPFSGGAILGDRIRMGDVASDPGVFVRSMATRGALGGLARGTLDAVDILGRRRVRDGGHRDGRRRPGRSGRRARGAHDGRRLVARLGDDIQAIKAGILEIADIHVVGKSDRPDADKTAADLKAMPRAGRSLPAQRIMASVRAQGLRSFRRWHVRAAGDDRCPSRGAGGKRRHRHAPRRNQ